MPEEEKVFRQPERPEQVPESMQQHLELGENVNTLAEMKGHTDGPPPWEGPDMFED